MKNVRIDYTIYSPQHKASRNSQGQPQEGHGECWDSPTMRSAKRLARRFGAGSIIVRNFNQNDNPRGRGEWMQAGKCWIWNGRHVSKADSLVDKKWVVPMVPSEISVLRAKLCRNR